MPSGLAAEIERLKKERRAVILAHYFQTGEVQAVADHVGDKLELCRIAAGTDAEVIVVCGVAFMAEMVSILRPDRVVLLPDKNAGCPMAEMVKGEDVRKIRLEHPGAKVVSYIKSKAEVKAESDYCADSDAVALLDSLDGQEVIFTPDKYMGSYLAQKTKKRLTLMNAYCPPRIRILSQDIDAMRRKHPGAEVLVHPQCRPEVVAMADRVLGDGGMVEYVKGAGAREFIIGSEVGILYPLRRLYPDKRFYPASPRALCQNMKLIDQEKVLWSLQDMIHQVNVPEDLAQRVRGKLLPLLEGP